MNTSSFKKAFGLLLVCIGITGLSGLFFFYTVILFSDTWTILQGLNEGFKLLFTVPTGILVIYASFFAVFIPFLLLVLLGVLLFSGKKYLRLWQLAMILLVWLIAIILGSVTTLHQVQKIIDRIQPFSADPLQFEVSRQIPYEVQAAFASTLKAEVDSSLGKPIEGYEPYMFLEVFPGLAESDFEGAQASIGMYEMQDGRLVHKPDDTRLIHSAAKVLTDEGLYMLLANVSVRLGIDLTQEGTLTEVMQALVRKNEAGAPFYPDPVACTMDAKICPDGSAVGRQGPSCEFAPCP
jgi:hypothetical protein